VTALRRRWQREVEIEDLWQKLAVIGVDIAILALICASLFSGEPAFKTKATIVSPVQISSGH
jgi:hypothetical protein